MTAEMKMVVVCGGEHIMVWYGDGLGWLDLAGVQPTPKCTY